MGWGWVTTSGETWGVSQDPGSGPTSGGSKDGTLTPHPYLTTTCPAHPQFLRMCWGEEAGRAGDRGPPVPRWWVVGGPKAGCALLSAGRAQLGRAQQAP